MTGAEGLTTEPLLRVCHVMSADLWAGAEAQVATLASFLVGQPTVQLSAVLFNDGWLASELRRLGVDFEIVDEQTHTSAAIVTSPRRWSLSASSPTLSRSDRSRARARSASIPACSR